MRQMVVLLLILLLPGLVSAQTPETPPAPPIVFTHVTVIDVTGAPSRSDRTVIVTGNRIAAVDKRRSVANVFLFRVFCRRLSLLPSPVTDTVRVGKPIQDVSNIKCQWDHCEALAAKHVRFGFRLFPGIDGPCGRAVTPMEDHYDLCETHVEEALDHYLDHQLCELNECPLHCGD